MFTRTLATLSLVTALNGCDDPQAQGLAADWTVNASVERGAGGDSATAAFDLDEGAGQTAMDITGRGNTLVRGNNDGDDSFDAAWVAGRDGSALGFNGTHFAYVPASDGTEPANVSVELWVQSSGMDDRAYLLSKGAQNCYGAAYGVYTDGTGTLRFYIFDGTSNRASAGVPASAITGGEWRQVVGTYDGTTPKLYVDGVQVTGPSDIGTGPIVYSQAHPPLVLGQYSGTCSYGFTGNIDDVTIFPFALDAQQVAARFQ
jgi:hypothetical protein